MLMNKSSCACNATKETTKRINFDSNGKSFVMDNSANFHMCSDKSYFADLHLFTEMEIKVIISIDTVVHSANPKGIGTMHLK